jgi:hypothetical protein
LSTYQAPRKKGIEKISFKTPLSTRENHEKASSARFFSRHIAEGKWALFTSREYA